MMAHHPTGKGALRVGMLLLLVWWAWNYTTLVTNFFDPGMIPFRLMLIARTARPLPLMAAATPEINPPSPMIHR